MHRVLHLQYIYCLQFYLMYLKSVSSFTPHVVGDWYHLHSWPLNLASCIEDYSLYFQPLSVCGLTLVIMKYLALSCMEVVLRS